ncbi:MAG: hypothetical protein ACI39U_03650 [Candidatus Cryptobacteroides sp.]
MDYSKIKDLKTLEAAQKKLSRKIAKKEKEVRNKYRKASNAYSPTSLTASAIHGFSGTIPFDRMILNLLRKAIRRLSK